MTVIYVDADACPVKEEVVRVADRHAVSTYMVSDGGIRPHPSPLVEIVVVAPGMDAADDWIAEHAGPGDVVVTNDILLADRCLKAGARAVRPNGDEFTPASIGMDVARRDLMAGLRDAGMMTGGPRSFSKADRSRFLSQFENMVRAAMRESEKIAK